MTTTTDSQPTATTASRSPRSRSHPPKTAIAALRLVVERRDYLHPITGLPLSTAQLAEMVGGHFDTADRRRKPVNDDEDRTLCRRWWWGNAAGKVVSSRAVASALRKYHPEIAEVILSVQHKANQTKRQRTLREAQTEVDRKAKRRSYDRARKKRLKEAQIIKAKEAEARARQIREERREAARQQAKAVPSSSSSSSSPDKQPSPTTTPNGDGRHV